MLYDYFNYNDSFIALKKSKIPRLALTYTLCRGELPNQLKDLTWVGEMVRAIYLDASDPAQFTVTLLHGNTCAHEMNVVSTANILPPSRTPTDVRNMLKRCLFRCWKIEL